MPLTTCRHCGGNLQKTQTTAKLFHLQTVQDITIVEYTCPACGYADRVDGSELCSLRKQHFKSEALGCFEIVFTWDLLYYVRDQIEEGTFYYSVLKQMMKWYKRDGWKELQLCGLQSLYPILKEAFMDFIDLMQLPLNSQWCMCAGQHLIADGVTVATRRSAMHFSGGWLPVPTSPGDPLVEAHFGSEYAKRFAIKCKMTRTALRPILSTEGCTPGQLHELQSLCKEGEDGLHLLFDPDNIERMYDDVGAGGGIGEDNAQVDPDSAIYHPAIVHVPTDASFVEELPNGMLIVSVWARAFLRELSADSPAVAIAPLKDARLLEHWRSCILQQLQLVPQSGACWSEEDDDAAHRSLPRLWQCLRSVHGLAVAGKALSLCHGFAVLVKNLVEVRLVLPHP